MPSCAFIAKIARFQRKPENRRLPRRQIYHILRAKHILTIPQSVTETDLTVTRQTSESVSVVMTEDYLYMFPPLPISVLRNTPTFPMSIAKFPVFVYQYFLDSIDLSIPLCYDLRRWFILAPYIWSDKNLVDRRNCHELGKLNSIRNCPSTHLP